MLKETDVAIALVLTKSENQCASMRTNGCSKSLFLYEEKFGWKFEGKNKT